jgi:hypothetical protein
MNGDTKTTTDHNEIRRWAEDRGGRPVRVHGVFGKTGDATDLRIDFLFDKYDDDVEQISWEDFFAQLDREQMVLVYQTETEGGSTSRFARIVRKEDVQQAVIE